MIDLPALYDISYKHNGIEYCFSVYAVSYVAALKTGLHHLKLKEVLSPCDLNALTIKVCRG